MASVNTPEAQRWSEADAFRTAPRQQALRQFPELKRAYGAVDALRKVVEQSYPANADVAQRVDLALRNAVALQVQQGVKTDVTPELRQQVRVEVAYANLVQAVDDRRLDKPEPYALHAQDRQLLVQTAQDTVLGKTPTFGIDPVDAPASRAGVVARELSGLDYPKRENPFTELRLHDLYTRDTHYRQMLEQQIARQREPGLGL